MEPRLADKLIEQAMVRINAMAIILEHRDGIKFRQDLITKNERDYLDEAISMLTDARKCLNQSNL